MGGWGRNPNRIAWLGQSGSAGGQERLVDPSASTRSIVPSTPSLSLPPSGRASSCRRYRRRPPWAPMPRPTPESVGLALGRIAVPSVAELPPNRGAAVDGRPGLDRIRERRGVGPDRKAGIDAADPLAELCKLASVGGLVSARSIDRRIDVEVAVTGHDDARGRRREGGAGHRRESDPSRASDRRRRARRNWRLRHVPSALGSIPSNAVDQEPCCPGLGGDLVRPEGVGRAGTTWPALPIRWPTRQAVLIPVDVASQRIAAQPARGWSRRPTRPASNRGRSPAPDTLRGLPGTA